MRFTWSSSPWWKSRCICRRAFTRRPHDGSGLRPRHSWRRAMIVLLLPLAAACSKTAARSEAPGLDQSCQVVAAAPAGGDRDIARLQDDLRQRQAAARAAEHLGYRFVARARVSNAPGDYAIAEQAA